jgi:CDP-diacylglycerol--glycerol-3-phosphate 3-phosphatidyltransferase
VPSIYELKPAFQRLLRPMVGALARGGITANHVTLAAAILSIAVGGWLAAQARQSSPRTTTAISTRWCS